MKTSPPPGSEVGVRFGGRMTLAVIVEDRGVFHGTRIVRIRLGDGTDPDALDFEIPLDELGAAASAFA